MQIRDVQSCGFSYTVRPSRQHVQQEQFMGHLQMHTYVYMFHGPAQGKKSTHSTFNISYLRLFIYLQAS